MGLGKKGQKMKDKSSYKIKREAHIEALFIGSALIHRVTDQDSDQFNYKVKKAMEQIASSLHNRAIKLERRNNE